MKAILNNKDYLKDEICKAIDNAGAAAPYGNITNGDILDALLELRDTLLTNIAKLQQIMEQEMWLARDKDGELIMYEREPFKVFCNHLPTWKTELIPKPLGNIFPLWDINTNSNHIIFQLQV